MIAKNLKLKADDEIIIQQYLSSTVDQYVDFGSLLVSRWDQRWFVKAEVEEQLIGMKLSFRESARKVAIAMCLKKAQGLDYGERFFNKEKEGFYFVRRIFAVLRPSSASQSSRVAGFYDAMFWQSPNVLVWTIDKIDAWFDNKTYPDSFGIFLEDQVLEILGPNPRTDPDYPL